MDFEDPAELAAFLDWREKRFAVLGSQVEEKLKDRPPPPNPLNSHSSGHAFTYDGILYYSPNTDRPFVPPSPNGATDYPFNPRHDTIANFSQPRWLTPAWSYFAFIPIVPSFTGPFSPLSDANIALERQEDGRFGLPLSTLQSWCSLEYHLVVVIKFFRNYRTSFLASPPPLPSSFGFTRTFSTRTAASHFIRRSRDWFTMFIGLIAFYFTQLDGPRKWDPGVDGESLPPWFGMFIRGNPNFSQVWLSGLRSYMLNLVLNRSQYAVGALADPWNPKQVVPEVTWLFSLGIPVWYVYDAQYVKYKSSIYMPPSKILDRAAPFIPTQSSTVHSPLYPTINRTPVRRFLVPQSPLASSSHPQTSQQFSSLPTPRSPLVFSPRPQTTHLPSPSPLPTSGEILVDQGHDNFEERRAAHLATKPWEPFFSSRLALYREPRSLKERQRILNRQRNPPTVSAEVYLWDWSDDDPCILVRARVLKQDRVVAIHNPLHRRIYYAPKNVWDVCRYFPVDMSEPCPLDPDCEDEVDSEDEHEISCNADVQSIPDDSEAIQKQVEESMETCIQVSPPEPTIRPIEVEIDLRPSQSGFDSSSEDGTDAPSEESPNILVFLKVFYGFIPPLPWPQPTTIKKDQWAAALKTVGLLSAGIPHPQLGPTIKTFLTDMYEPTKPTLLWDLNPTSQAPLNVATFRSHICDVDGKFVIHPQAYREANNLTWVVALRSLDGAVRAFRVLQSESHSPQSLALKLLDYGIPFYTFHPLSLRHASPLPSVDLTPIRVVDYKFTLEDYVKYIEERARLLSSPRGRAALLYGGLIQRIAREHIGLESAALGPSEVVIKRGQGQVCIINEQLYGDDMLTDNEIGVICGLYHCLTGSDMIFILITVC